MSGDKSLEFYKRFYERERVRVLQYNSLRKHFNKMVKEVLGEGYYNTEMDVYGADQATCEAITSKVARKSFFRRPWDK
jgi:hypothetical protein